MLDQSVTVNSDSTTIPTNIEGPGRPYDPAEGWVAKRPGRCVYAALNAVQAAIVKIGIPKDRENKEQGYRFRSIDAVYATLSPLLAEHRLLMLPRAIASEQVERVTKSGTAKFCTRVTFEFDFVSAVDGSVHTVRTYGEGMDMADKSTNKAMSAAYKYAAFMAFGIPLVGEVDADDDDGGEPTVPGAVLQQAQIETAPKFRGAVKSALVGVTIEPERQQELRVIGKSLIDLVDQEQAEFSVDNGWKILELTEPLTNDEELWLSAYLKPHSRTRTRMKAVSVEAAKAAAK